MLKSANNVAKFYPYLNCRYFLYGYFVLS